MPTSFGDALNIGASVVTIAGALVSVVGFVRKLLASPTTPPASAAYPAQPGYPPAGYAPQPGYTQPTYPPSGYPPQAPQPPQRQGYPPTTGYPQQPGYPAGYPAGGAHVATAPRRHIPHPAILWTSALAMLCVVIYSVEYLTLNGGTITTHDPRFFVNIVLFTINLVAGGGAVIGLLVIAARGNRWGWFSFGVVGLLIMLFTIGIFSIAALAPTFFFALYDRPRAR